LQVVGSSLWGLVVPNCPLDAVCPATLVISDDAGRTWRRRDIAPVVQVGPLLRVSRRGAFVASVAPETTKRVVVTTDGAQNWTVRANPCQSHLDVEARLAHFGTQDLWLLCDSQPTAGTQGKSLYHSSDGAAHWSLVAAAPGPANSQAAVRQIPGNGYSGDLVFISPSVGFLGLGRGTLLGSHDGGRTWTAVVTDPAVDGIDRVVFIDALHGWASTATAEGAVIYRTTDGGKTWTALPVS
jgi:hypothetical protein